MRLLTSRDDGEFSLVEYIGNSSPPYAILSHTWGADGDEVTFKDLIEGTGKNKVGYRKLEFCGKQAARDGLQYFWVDTCCIDKASSSELSEAINSMFHWYQKAHRCYVYLPDVSADTPDAVRCQQWIPAFKSSRWFTRGWTLQELIAPASVGFFSAEGLLLGDKQSLEQPLNEITGIAVEALQGRYLTQFSVHDRMSWARKRETKREEDAAYSLLGIFDIQMPLLYGEGKAKALRRLQKEVKETLITPSRPTQDSTSTSRFDNPSLPQDMRSSDTKSEHSPFSEETRREIIGLLQFKQRDVRLLTLKSAETKTCRWLLKNDLYKDWMNTEKLEQHHGFFWIKGKPGTGKSIMMKFLFSKAKKIMKGSLVLAFFFNARGGDLEKSTSGLYRALLLQLLEKPPETLSIPDSLGKSGLEFVKGAGWSNETLQDLLVTALESCGCRHVVCDVDALDECSEDNIRDMVSFFEELGRLERAAQFHICFSSRHYPEINIRTGLQLVLESSGTIRVTSLSTLIRT